MSIIRIIALIALCAVLVFAQATKTAEVAKAGTPAAAARSAAPAAAKEVPVDEITAVKLENIQLKAQVAQQAQQQAQQQLQLLGRDFDALVGGACTKAALPAPCKVDKDPAGNWILVGKPPEPPAPPAK